MPQQLQQRILDMLNQLRLKWQALGRSKQIRFSVAAFVLVAALAAAVYLFTRPEMTVLQANMDPQQLSAAVTALTEAGIKSQVGNSTTSILVDAKDLDRARLALADNPNIKPTGFTYDDALEVSIGTTESTKSKMMVLAKQTEIEDSIKQLYGVNNATVIVNMPEESPFILRDQDMPSSSVILDLNESLTSRQVEAIAYHVSKSVHNLKPENVSIMDTKGTSLYQAGADGIAGAMSAHQEFELGKKYEIENQVRTLLSPQYNTVDVMANIQWDWTGSQTEQTTYVPPVEGSTSGVPTKEIINESEVTNTEPAQEPGVQANNGQTQYPTGEGANSEATNRSSDIDYLYDTTHTILSSPGTGKVLLNDSSLAVRVYLTRQYTEDAARESGDLEGVTWEDYQTNIKLNPIPVAIPQQTLDLIRSATGIQTVVLEGYELPEFVSTETVVRPINQLLMAGILLLLIALLAFGLIRRTQPDVITEIEPELSVEELLVSSSAQDEEPEEHMAEIDFFADSELKKQIDKFIDEKPEAAAQLLRNWLSEEWE